MKTQKGDRLFILLFLILGTLFRIIWPSDMEWKVDERYLFQISQWVYQHHQWPWVGIPSVITFCGIRIYPHYLIILYPFPQLWVSWLLSDRIWLLKATVVAQCLITVLFLLYIHRTEESLRSEYGLTYCAQQKALR